jgi:hypothetical protein
MKTLFASALLALSLSVSSFAAPTNPTPPPFEAAVRAIGERLEVAVSNPNQIAKMTIRLLDERGQTLAVKYLGTQAPVSVVRFDLQQVSTGTYQVEIAGGQARQVKTVTLGTAQRTLVVD